MSSVRHHETSNLRLPKSQSDVAKFTINNISNLLLSLKLTIISLIFLASWNGLFVQFSEHLQSLEQLINRHLHSDQTWIRYMLSRLNDNHCLSRTLYIVRYLHIHSWGHMSKPQAVHPSFSFTSFFVRYVSYLSWGNKWESNISWGNNWEWIVMGPIYLCDGNHKMENREST